MHAGPHALGSGRQCTQARMRWGGAADKDTELLLGASGCVVQMRCIRATSRTSTIDQYTCGMAGTCTNTCRHISPIHIISVCWWWNTRHLSAQQLDDQRGAGLVVRGQHRAQHKGGVHRRQLKAPSLRQLGVEVPSKPATPVSCCTPPHGHMYIQRHCTCTRTWRSVRRVVIPTACPGRWLCCGGESPLCEGLALHVSMVPAVQCGGVRPVVLRKHAVLAPRACSQGHRYI